MKNMKFIKWLLPHIPKKENNIIITLHDSPSKYRKWFEDVIDLISSKYGFFCPEEIDIILNGGKHQNKVLLTFDDGFRSNKAIIEELLTPRGIRSIVFVTENFLGLSGKPAKKFAKANFFPSTNLENEFKHQFDALSVDDLICLKKQGHTIGAHTANHAILSKISSVDKQNEIIGSADRLEQKIGSKIDCFSYPFGSLVAVDKKAVQIASERFSIAFSNIRGGIQESPSRYFIYRQSVVPGMPIWILEAIIEGKFDFRHFQTRRKAKLKFSDYHDSK